MSHTADITITGAGVIGLAGIETPGLTSSLAIGKYVSRMANEIL